MKKVIALLLTLAMFFAVAACTPAPVPEEPVATEAPAEEPVATEAPAPTEAPAAETYEIAMVTDIGTIDDQSFNQGTWEGIETYAKANNKTYKYYQPTEQSNDAYLAAIQLAVEGGAKVIATPGFLFEEPIYIAQDMYPEVTFILIDGNPHNADYSEYRTNKNAVGVVFAEEQSGYLAGYAAVKDGYTKLGFMGGMAVPAVVRFGYGFVQGAEAAAAELGLGSIEIKYHYTGGFDATPEVQALAASWYNEGTEVIFGCGGGVGFSVFAAAEAAGKPSIGVDVDQSFLSASVITSAMKGIGEAANQLLTKFYDGSFPGGEAIVLDASNQGVKLPMETSKFKTFSQADYDALYAKLAAGEVKILKDTDAATANDLGVKIAKVTVVE
jgi:basic membrane protein A